MAEYSEAEIERMARAAWEACRADDRRRAQNCDDTGPFDESWPVDAERVIEGQRTSENGWDLRDEFVDAVLAERARIDAERTQGKPLLTEWRGTWFGNNLRRFAVDETQAAVTACPDGSWKVWTDDFDEAVALAKGAAESGDLEGARLAADAAARQWYTLPEDAERTPAPSVEECEDALRLSERDAWEFCSGTRAVDSRKLHAFLSALPDEARRVGMAAVKGGK